jgi:hypothetical protein
MGEQMYARLNSNDPSLTKFRRNVMLECGADPDDTLVDYTFSNLSKKYQGNPRIEDIYRYTKLKWDSTHFDHVDTHWVDDEVSCISGAVRYGSWIKGAVYHYNLRKYSIENRTLLFKDGGMLDRLIAYAEELGLDGVFISVYPHNQKLKSLVKRLKNGLSIPTTGNLEKIRSLRYHGVETINNIQQEIFYHPMKENGVKLDQIFG